MSGGQIASQSNRASPGVAASLDSARGRQPALIAQEAAGVAAAAALSDASSPGVVAEVAAIAAPSRILPPASAAASVPVAAVAAGPQDFPVVRAAASAFPVCAVLPPAHRAQPALLPVRPTLQAGSAVKGTRLPMLNGQRSKIATCPDWGLNPRHRGNQV